MDLFKKEWLQLSGLPMEKKLKAIKDPLRKWNTEVVGRIDLKIQSFQEKISKLDLRAQTQVLQDCKWHRREALQSQLWLCMARKERFWKQLSRCKILKEGDRNTKYFHLLASLRRQRKLITKIMDNGKEVTKLPAIKKIIMGNFKKLYRKQESSDFDISTLGLRMLSPLEAGLIEVAVSEVEIKEAFLSCHPPKAPRYDGFNLKCLRKVWHVVGDDFIQYIKHFFETASFHPSINTTWVTLIPKKKGSLDVADVRLISLVGSAYKIITKILSRRLKQVLPSLIGETQTAFVSRRQILDGALIANEIVNCLKRKRKAGFLLKLDFQKAYDTID